MAKEKDEILTIFANGLANYQVRTRKNQSEIALDAGAARSNVSFWLNAKTMPSLQIVANLLSAGMLLEEVFGKDLAERIIERERSERRAESTPEDSAAVVRSGLQALLDSLR